jgi:hypothetical protein
MPVVKCILEREVCLWLLILRHTYRDIGGHLSLGAQGRIPFGVFRKHIWARCYATFPIGFRVRNMASSSLPSL